MDLDNLLSIRLYYTDTNNPILCMAFSITILPTSSSSFLKAVMFVGFGDHLTPDQSCAFASKNYLKKDLS